MVCQIFYQSVNEGINCIGESCEKCYPLFNWLFGLIFIIIITMILYVIAIIIYNRNPKYWIKCDRCNEPMKNYTLQAYTNEGDKFFCKNCADEFIRQYTKP